MNTDESPACPGLGIVGIDWRNHALFAACMMAVTLASMVGACLFVVATSHGDLSGSTVNMRIETTAVVLLLGGLVIGALAFVVDQVLRTQPASQRESADKAERLSLSAWLDDPIGGWGQYALCCALLAAWGVSAMVCGCLCVVATLHALGVFSPSEGIHSIEATGYLLGFASCMSGYAAVGLEGLLSRLRGRAAHPAEAEAKPMAQAESPV